jgi:hypothetical protein
MSPVRYCGQALGAALSAQDSFWHHRTNRLGDRIAMKKGTCAPPERNFGGSASLPPPGASILDCYLPMMSEAYASLRQTRRYPPAHARSNQPAAPVSTTSNVWPSNTATGQVKSERGIGRYANPAAWNVTNRTAHVDWHRSNHLKTVTSFCMFAPAPIVRRHNAAADIGPRRSDSADAVGCGTAHSKTQKRLRGSQLALRPAAEPPVGSGRTRGCSEDFEPRGSAESAEHAIFGALINLVAPGIGEVRRYSQANWSRSHSMAAINWPLQQAERGEIITAGSSSAVVVQ